MASNDLNKSKNSSLEESLALEAYLRNSIGDLNTSVSKKDRVPLASRLDRELAPFNPDLRSENAIVRGDADQWDFEAGLGPSNYRKSLLPSVLSYFAVAIVCGGVSGGALLYDPTGRWYLPPLRRNRLDIPRYNCRKSGIVWRPHSSEDCQNYAPKAP